jgi:hypothetical protein
LGGLRVRRRRNEGEWNGGWRGLRGGIRFLRSTGRKWMNTDDGVRWVFGAGAYVTWLRSLKSDCHSCLLNC